MAQLTINNRVITINDSDVMLLLAGLDAHANTPAMQHNRASWLRVQKLRQMISNAR